VHRIRDKRADDARKQAKFNRRNRWRNNYMEMIGNMGW
jgi:hypothetical protein